MLLDSICSAHFKQNLEILGLDSTWVLYSLQTGSKLEQADIGAVLRKRISLVGTTLKSRSCDYKT